MSGRSSIRGLGPRGRGGRVLAAINPQSIQGIRNPPRDSEEVLPLHQFSATGFPVTRTGTVCGVSVAGGGEGTCTTWVRFHSGHAVSDYTPATGAAAGTRVHGTVETPASYHGRSGGAHRDVLLSRGSPFFLDRGHGRNGAETARCRRRRLGPLSPAELKRFGFCDRVHRRWWRGSGCSFGAFFTTTTTSGRRVRPRVTAVGWKLRGDLLLLLLLLVVMEVMKVDTRR